MSDIYNSTAAIAAKYGPDVAIETAAQSFDAVCGFSCGDILRDAWCAVVAELLRAGPAAAASSGAQHELEFYGGQQ